MMRGQLLFVLWCSSILAVTTSSRVLRCFSDFRQNISCILDFQDSPMSNYSLTFTGIASINWGNVVSCPLVRKNRSYHCNCGVKEEMEEISFHDKYNISLCYESDCHVVVKDFYPYKNIQLTSPPEFDVQHTNESVNIIWNTKRYEGHYLEDCLIYNFKLQASQGDENNLTSQGLDFVSLDRSELKTNTEYCVKARYKPDAPKCGFLGTWSEWSKPQCWTNETKEDTSEQENIFILLAKYLSPVCISAVVLLLFFYSPAARMKIKTIAHTPSPAPFFNPLFHQHEGNLQEWLSPQGKFVLTYKAEEDLITDNVTITPKPITKDPEESQSFISPPVTHLVFPQSLTSYVGLPGMHEAPPPIITPVTIVCAETTPYTQLPCPLWGFDASEIRATSPPPEDFMEMSKADSGCSCEDLSFSPECSLPSSPVVESPPPHLCSDYCILNKTSEGIVPVLLSKQSAGKVLSDPQQADE